MKIWSKLWDWNDSWSVAVILIFYIFVIFLTISLIFSRVGWIRTIFVMFISYSLAAFIVGIKYTQKKKMIMSNEMKLKVLLCYFILLSPFIAFYLLLIISAAANWDSTITASNDTIKNIKYILLIILLLTVLPALEIYFGLSLAGFCNKLRGYKNYPSYKRNADGTFICK